MLAYFSTRRLHAIKKAGNHTLIPELLIYEADSNQSYPGNQMAIPKLLIHDANDIKRLPHYIDKSHYNLRQY